MYRKDQLLLEEAYELVQLNELFESPYPFAKDNKSSFLATRYIFSPSGNPSSFPQYKVSFDLDPQEVSLVIVFHYQSDELAKPTMELTGSGNASKVMGTIMAITKEYLSELIASDIDDLQYAEISFSAKLSEEGRVKFYDTLASLLTKFLNKATAARQIEWSWSSLQNSNINRNPNASKGYFVKAKPKSKVAQSSGEEKITKGSGSLNKFL